MSINPDDYTVCPDGLHQVRVTTRYCPYCLLDENGDNNA